MKVEDLTMNSALDDQAMQEATGGRRYHCYRRRYRKHHCSFRRPRRCGYPRHGYHQHCYKPVYGGHVIQQQNQFA